MGFVGIPPLTETLWGRRLLTIRLGIHSGPPERSCRTTGETSGSQGGPRHPLAGRDRWLTRDSNTGTGCTQSDRNALCAGLERRVLEKVVRSTPRDGSQSSSPLAVKPIWRPRSRDPSASRSAHRIAPVPRKAPGATVELYKERVSRSRLRHTTPKIPSVAVGG